MPPDMILDAVSRVFALKGRNAEPKMLTFIVKEMRAEFNLHYFYLSIEEVKSAFDHGVFGEYGEYYEISVVTLCKWLDCYCNSDERQRYIESRRPPVKAIVQTATITAQEKVKAEMDFIEGKFMEYKHKGVITFAAPVCYDILLKHGFFAPDRDSKIAAFDRAKKLIEGEKKAKAATFSLQSHLQSMLSPQEAKAKQICKAQEILVYQFFNAEIEQDGGEMFLNTVKQKCKQNGL